MLDGNKDHLKLEAMKRIISMVAKVCSVTLQTNMFSDIFRMIRVGS